MDNNIDIFMIEEYKQIAQAFFALHNQKNQLFRYYLTLMTISASFLGVISQLIPIIMPNLKLNYNTEFFGVIILVLSIIGVVILNSLIGVRHDMITYARTINEIRGYFCMKNQYIVPYLVLPHGDYYPPFFECFPKYFFWEVALISIINSSFLTFSLRILNFFQFIINNLFNIQERVLIMLNWILFAILQLFIYWILSRKTEDHYNLLKIKNIKKYKEKIEPKDKQ